MENQVPKTGVPVAPENSCMVVRWPQIRDCGSCHQKSTADKLDDMGQTEKNVKIETWSLNLFYTFTVRTISQLLIYCY